MIVTVMRWHFRHSNCDDYSNATIFITDGINKEMFILEDEILRIFLYNYLSKKNKYCENILIKYNNETNSLTTNDICVNICFNHFRNDDTPIFF